MILQQPIKQKRMTWKEWVNSSYNVDNYVLSQWTSIDIVSVNKSDGTVIFGGTTTERTDMVSPDDIISSDLIYGSNLEDQFCLFKIDVVI